MSKRRTRQIDKQIVQQPVRTTDAFMNALARMGLNQPNLLEGTEYPLTRLTRNYNLLNSLYRSHWIIRRIIDTIPEDMCKARYTLTTNVAPDLLDRFQKMERRTKTQARILEGLKWGRLYGGAAAVMVIDGHEDMLYEKLDYDMIMPGSFKGLMVFDRWSGITPGPDLVEDINDPDFGLPDYYQVTTQEGCVFQVHHSRVLRFIGRDVPYWEKQAEVHWGISEVEVVFDELKKRDNTSWNIANLVFLANLRVLKMNQLGQDLAIANGQVQQDLYNTLQAQNWLMSNMGLYVMDKEDEFDTKQYTFAGINDIYESFMLDVAGACEIPVTKLFGRSPAGLNATGESDLQNYYDVIDKNQESHLRPVLDKLLPIMALSEWGAIPDDLDYTFNPIRTPSDKDLAELVEKKSNTVVAVFNAGLISQKIALKELKQMSDTTGLFSNITDEDIERADEFTTMPGEDLLNGLGTLEAQAPNRGELPQGNPAAAGPDLAIKR